MLRVIMHRGLKSICNIVFHYLCNFKKYLCFNKFNKIFMALISYQYEKAKKFSCNTLQSLI